MGLGVGRIVEEIMEDVCLVEGSRVVGFDIYFGLVFMLVELFWINIDFKEFKKVFSYLVVGFFEISSFFLLGFFLLGLEELYGVDDYLLWVWVLGGGCMVEVCVMFRWFIV